MLNKLQAVGEGLRQRFGAWREYAKERAAVRRMEKQAVKAHDPHAHSRFWLLNVPALATICAAIVEWYWAMLFCIEATGALEIDWATSMGSDAATSGAWHFTFDIQSVAVLIGLICATIPIVMLSMVWLPVQFAMRGAGVWRRGSIILVGLLANILVIVSGTVVMNYNRQDQVREAVVIEQTASQGRAAIDARLAFEQEQLRLALSNTNPYLNQAANVGAAEWERSYVAQARASNDPRLPMLERALGAARAADQRRANIERLTVERATAAPEAATAANIDDNVGRELNTFAQYVEVWRPPFVAFICTLIGIFGAWWTLAMLERLNPRDVLRSGWADDKHRIEDLRHEEPIASNEMVPPREDIVDAETGERLTRVKPHLRKVRARKGERTQVQVTPPPMEDERGVAADGGGRIASAPVAASELISEGDQHEHENNAEHQPNDDTTAHDEGHVIDNIQTDQPELSSEDQAAIDEYLLADTPVDAPDPDPQQDASAEDDQQNDETVEEHQEPQETEREPETRDERLLAPAK